MTLLSVNGVIRRFRGVVALDDVSFSVAEGQIAGIMGANGAGKTTLFSIIAGNLRPMPARSSSPVDELMVCVRIRSAAAALRGPFRSCGHLAT